MQRKYSFLLHRHRLKRERKLSVCLSVCLSLCTVELRGNSNDYTQYIILNMYIKKIDLNYLKSAAIGLFPRDSGTSSKRPW